jgi:Mg-chelatase subunit ChlD
LDSSCASANFRGGRKKKVIAEADGDESEGNRSIQFQSIFKTVEKGKKKAPDELPPLLMPPEGSIDPMDDELSAELSSASQWDIATRYHEFKARPSMQALTKKLRKLSAEAILERAREVLGSVVHPVEQRSAPWTEVPAHADQPEVDLEETIENSPLGVTSHDLEPQDIWMEYNVHRKQPIVLSVDTSLSMTGEKLALTAVALAVVLIQFPDDPVGIVAFENEAMILKRPDEKITVAQLVERFLDVPAQGYTHLEDGMKASLKLALSARGSHGGSGVPSTVLLTDGKYTAGKDPAYLAPRFPHLVVLKMGKERASLELCRELARKGHGVLREVGELEALPTVMYGVVKDLLRGKSLI